MKKKLLEEADCILLIMQVLCKVVCFYVSALVVRNYNFCLYYVVIDGFGLLQGFMY